MEGRGDRQQHRALGALRLARCSARSTAALCAGNHDLAGRIIVGDLADLVAVAASWRRRRRRQIQAEERGHGAAPDRHGLLHRVAAHAQQPGGVGEGKAAGGGKRGIFAERVAGDIGGVCFEPKRPRLERPQRRDADTAISAGWAFA